MNDMAKGNWIFKKGNWFQGGQKQKGFGSVVDKVVKILKPEGFYIPIKVTETIYTPSSKEKAGERTVIINICNIERYGESTMYGKPQIKTCIETCKGIHYVKETWSQIDALCTAAVNLSKSKPVQQEVSK
jgi:hypothetical protein